MQYDFDKLIPRRGTNAVKWDATPPAGDGKDIIPLWVADMDFQVAPCILEALHKRVDHGIFGYTVVPDSYYEAVVRWFGRRHGWHIEKDWIQYTTAVVPALSAVIKALTEPGDKVVIQTPVYNCFFSSIRNNGCTALDAPLLEDGNTYRFDYEALDKACADPKAKILLLCNPHNPAGRVWTPEELARVGAIARKHGIAVVSDEIHCEIVMPGFKFTPYASVEGNQPDSVTLGSPSKSFNTAGLQIANIICDNPAIREKIDRAININEICDVNPFGPVALEAAYSEEGEAWLNGMNAYVAANYQYLLDHITEGFKVFRLEGTYLAWVDARSLGIPSQELEDSLLEHEKVWVNAGAMYGTEGFFRVNLACPRSPLAEGLKRLDNGLKRLKNQ